jgi:hypothetical protein
MRSGRGGNTARETRKEILCGLVEAPASCALKMPAASLADDDGDHAASFS